jgi:uncharacterized protein (DUF433 family)
VILSTVAAGKTTEEIITEYPYLEAEDVRKRWPTPLRSLRTSITWRCGPPREVPGR